MDVHIHVYGYLRRWGCLDSGGGVKGVGLGVGGTLRAATFFAYSSLFCFRRSSYVTYVCFSPGSRFKLDICASPKAKHSFLNQEHPKAVQCATVIVLTMKLHVLARVI